MTSDNFALWRCLYFVSIQLTVDISDSQGGQKTVRDIHSLRYQVVICFSCLPRHPDISKSFKIPSIWDINSQLQLTLKTFNVSVHCLIRARAWCNCKKIVRSWNTFFIKSATWCSSKFFTYTNLQHCHPHRKFSFSNKCIPIFGTRKS